MRYSIKFKLFAIMGGLIAFFVLISWLCNTQLLEHYYLYNKKSDLIKNYQVINSLSQNKPSGMGLNLEQLEFTRWLQIIILDPEFQLKYDSFVKDGESRPIRNRPGQKPLFFSIREKSAQIAKKRTLMEVTRDQRLNITFINLYALLDNGDYLQLRTPMAAISESVAIANRFFLLTGCLTILIGCLLVMFLTRKFTKPILDLKEIAQSMSLLDFNRKYHVRTRDEIGDLGDSINSLSEQLEKSIQELQQANLKLQEDIERERKIDEIRKEFITNVSHELKTPIALIQGYAEGLKVNVNEDEANKNFYCDVIMDEALKMNKLVKQLLDLSQMESGYFKLEMTNFELSRLIETVLKKNQLLFQERNILVVFEKEQELVVTADYDLIERVFGNYISNALHHVDQKRIIKVGIKQDGRNARVTVFNSGKLIDDIYFDKIWNSFYKIDKARTREYGGTGLGLSIVKAIQDAHHHRYGLQNLPDGVEFWFELALAGDMMGDLFF